ncbi:Yip1-like protein [Rhodovulum imhoffii]|uniref:Yip1-like protein n=1 Tax=Rhodovulum imhoffii TaxID=365340 RepID=A0A2T5BV88_9RHOB|nr:YIP1 family protein [Rhodovulum imhoffii]MBK5934265.1 hypothetical protein [Rhodovulum imhoffii]PTN03488.1 Yip1-like protein [Rhodovulum imhoffii]
MLKPLLGLARDTVSNPREGAGRVLAMPLREGQLWQALALIVVLSVLLTQAGDMLVPAPVDPLLPVFMQNPLLTATIQGALLVVMVFAIYWIGRGFGGRGGFGGALRLTVLLQFIMVCLQVVQTVALIVLPPVAGLIGILGIGLFFWLLSHFVTVLHGFRSPLKVFFMILLSMAGIVFGLSLVLSLLGMTFSGGMSDV